MKATEQESGQTGPASRISRRCLVLALSLTSVVIACSALTAAPASAHTTRFLLFSFASGTGPGASAVDQSTGDVYVAENPTGLGPVIAKYDASGNPVDFSALGASTLPIGGGEHFVVAVDPVSHDLYVGRSGGGIERFQASGQPAPYTAGPNAGTDVLTGAGTPNGSFNGILHIAVGSSGELYVADNLGGFAAEKFLPSGEYSGLQFPGGFPYGVAVNSSGDVYVNEGAVQEFGPLAEPLSTLNVSVAGSLVIDPQTGQIFISHGAGAGSSVSQLSPSGTLELEFGGHILNFPSNGQGPLSVNSAIVPDEGDGRVYVTDEATRVVDVFGAAVNIPTTIVGPVSNLGLGVATLNGTVNTDGTTPADALTDCHFDYVTQAAFEADVKAGRNGFSDLSSGASVRCIPGFASIPDDGNTHAVSAALTGLQPNTTYRCRLQASNEQGTDTEFQQRDFETAGPPVIDQTYATGVTSSSTSLSAEVNPHQLDTTYRFQYVDLATYEADIQANGPGHGFDHAIAIPTAGADLGSGATDAIVSAQLSGLAPDTTYHYRIVAANQAAPSGLDGPDLILTTQLRGGLLGLPDGRAWEQVTPTDKHGGGISHLGELPIQAAASGGALAYATTFPFEPDPQGYGNYSQNLATRRPAGWTSHAIDLPHAVPIGGAEFAVIDYAYFSTDLSLAALAPGGPFTSLAPEVFPADTERTLYLRHDASCEATPATCYAPLVTGAPGYADVPAGTKFGTKPGKPFILQFAGASPDLRHLVFTSSVTLSAGSKAGALYEYSAEAPPAEALTPVSIPPSGGAAVALANPPGVRGSVSSDGSRVVFAAGGLYMRVNATQEQSAVSGPAVDGSQCTEPAKACTLQLDAAQAGGSGSGGGTFQLASADASKVFFTDSERLVVGSTAEPGRPDLYEYDLARPAGQRLTDLTAHAAGSADVQSAVIGAAEDGSAVYFVADGVLTGAEENARHEKAEPGSCKQENGSPAATCNLYVYHAGADVRFIANLSGADHESWVGTSGGDPQMPSRVSPNGQFLAFMSARPLTGYDNRDAFSGEPDEEVFLYDAGASGSTGGLVCASCNPTGARPHGTLNGNSKLVNSGQGLPLSPEGGVWFAASLPTWTNGKTSAKGRASYPPRSLSDSGRLFFDSFDALVPQDTNGTQDVYEYEQQGVGNCDAEQQTFYAGSGGCTSLISSGDSGEESVFLDASESGDDVFFLTASRLAATDTDTAYDIYDAHACSAGSSCPPPAPPSPPECAGAACQGFVEAPNDPSPGSLTFHGPGNQEPAPSAPPVKAKAKTKREHRKPRKHHRKHSRTSHSRGGRK